MATATTGASSSLALGATDAGCIGCAGKFVQTQVKTSTAFPYAAIGARTLALRHLGTFKPICHRRMQRRACMVGNRIENAASTAGQSSTNPTHHSQ